MTRYDIVAPVYDGLGTFYSGGGIRRAKLAHLKWLEPGARLLFPGAGCGAEALAAARREAEVTLVDPASAMIERARRAFEAAGAHAHFHECPIEELSPDAPFDTVIASFFLNVFARDELVPAIQTLLRFLEPGGQLVIADFRAPQSNWAFRWLQKAYYVPPLSLFAALTATPWHELYDYRAIIRQHRLPLEQLDEVVVQAFGLPLYEAVLFRKVNA